MISEKNRCPKCGAGMLLFHSLKMKICVDCNIKYPWPLDAGQVPLIQYQR
jgi:uncharacterized protein (DUF983 family)